MMSPSEQERKERKNNCNLIYICSFPLPPSLSQREEEEKSISSESKSCGSSFKRVAASGTGEKEEVNYYVSLTKIAKIFSENISRFVFSAKGGSSCKGFGV